jgi:hypothetical protein
MACVGGTGLGWRSGAVFYNRCARRGGTWAEARGFVAREPAKARLAPPSRCTPGSSFNQFLIAQCQAVGDVPAVIFPTLRGRQASVPVRLIRGTLPEQRPSRVARQSTPELKRITWEAMRAQGPVLAMASEDCADGKPDLGLDPGVLQAEIGTELGLSNWSPLPLVRQVKAHSVALPGCF